MALMALPADTVSENVGENDALPDPSVVTSEIPIKVWPSPYPVPSPVALA